MNLFDYSLEQRNAEQYPNNHTDEDKEIIHEARAQFCFLMQILGEVILEKQIDGRYGGAGQQEVFGYLVDVHLGECDERPVA